VEPKTLRCATWIACTFALIAAAPAAAQSDPSTSGPLYDELARLDSLLFDAAFVTCSAEKAISFFTDDVEFYHDQSGFESGQQVRDSFKRLTASCPGGRGIRRELVAGSLRVYPMKNYGAVQMGLHRFIERGAPTHTVARFVHLWRNKDGQWKITRVLSFDHLPTRDESVSRPTPSTP
jgi:ketosteroid isomerase-like protein